MAGESANESHLVKKRIRIGDLCTIMVMALITCCSCWEMQLDKVCVKTRRAVRRQAANAVTSGSGERMMLVKVLRGR